MTESSDSNAGGNVDGGAGPNATDDARAVAQATVAEMYSHDSAHRPEYVLDTVGVGQASLSLMVTEAMTNSHLTGHGGVIFTLADTAFAYACNSHGRPAVAAGASIEFISPAQIGDVLVADAIERNRSGRRGIYDITVTAGDRVVAIFQGRSTEIRSTDS